MSSLVDDGIIQTVAIEKVVAPIACHLCHLVLLCDDGEDPGRFTQLEGAAQAVAKATHNMAAVASRYISDTDDEALREQMSSLLDSVTLSGQHVLLAAQKLNIQPEVAAHREELVGATQGVLLGVVKVLLADDDAAVRKVLAAADQVLDSLSALGSCTDMESLLESFKLFSGSLLHLNQLTKERAKSLQDPGQTKVLLDSLETLRKCIPMLHTALCTTIKHPGSAQAQASRKYIVEKVQDTVGDITETLRSRSHRATLGPAGFYVETRRGLLRLLATSSIASIMGSGLDSTLRDLVFHCMAVASASRRKFQQRVVGHCRHVLQLWSDIKLFLKFSKEPEDSEQCLEDLCTMLVEQIHTLDSDLTGAILYQVLDTLTDLPLEGLVSVTRKVLDSDPPLKSVLDLVQPPLEDLICYMDRILQVAKFSSAMAADAKSLENVENSRTSLSRLRARVESLSLELGENSQQTVRKIHETCQRWEEETGQLQDALVDVMDVGEFSSFAINEISEDRRGCDEAYREQNYGLFEEHANKLICHVKLVIQAVRRHLDRSDNPIYRNGLLVLLKQVQSSHTNMVGSVADMLSGTVLNVEAYSSFTDHVSIAIQHCRVLREGLDGQQHPHLLSPLREDARQPVSSHSTLPFNDDDDDDELDLDDFVRDIESPALDGTQRDSAEEHEKEHSRWRTIEAEVGHKYDSYDLKVPAVSNKPKLIHQPRDFDLLPLLYEVVTVTNGKDVMALNPARTGVLELSNCYAQAAKEALAVVDAVDCQTLESLRAELVSLTPLLVQTAQETAMSSGMSTEMFYKHITMFSDLISNIRRVLLPAAGGWYHAIATMMQGDPATMAAIVAKQLNKVMTLCADVVQLLTSSDCAWRNDTREGFSVLQNKLTKAQNNTRNLAELLSSLRGHADLRDALGLSWALSVGIVLDSVDKILGKSTAVAQMSPLKQVSALAENSSRVQEAARLTSLSCRSAYRAKQLSECQEDLRTLTQVYLQAAEDVGMTPSLLQLARSEIFQRDLLIKMRVLLGHLKKTNKDYVCAPQNLISIAYEAVEHLRGAAAGEEEKEEERGEGNQQFETAAERLFENVTAASKSVEDCLNYIRDSQARSTLRSANDHLSFQISDVISRARLMVETHHVCDTLSLDVQVQYWAAKARFVMEEISKQEGIRQETKQQISAGLQVKMPEDMKQEQTTVANIYHQHTSIIKEEEFPPDTENTDSYQVDVPNSALVTKYGLEVEKSREDGSAAFKYAPSLTYTSLYLKRESNSWDPQDNRIVQETRQMADKIYYMTQYLKKKGPIPSKEGFVNTAKDVILNGQSITHFIRVIADHCRDKHCTTELTLIVEQIHTITNQLSIISSVNAITPGSKSSDEILVKNAQNLLQTILCGVHAAETACIKGLRQPEPHSDGAEATALCFQWKRNLEIHRAQQSSNQDTDELGLRKTSSHLVAPSLAPPVHM